MKWLRALRRDSALRGTAGSIAAGGALQLIVAASGIMAARLLGVTDRGHLALLWVVTLVVGQLSTLGLHVSIAFAIAGGATPAAVCGAVRRLIAAQLAAAAAVEAAVVLPLLGGVHGLTPASLVLTIIAAPSFVLLLHGLAIAQGQRRYRRVQLHRLVQPCLYVVVLALLAAAGQGRLSTVSAAWGITLVIGGLFAWRQCLGAWWPARPVADGDAVVASPRAMLGFGLRSLFSAFGVVEHLQADQLLVGLLLSAHGFGLYVAGSAFANLPRFLGQSIGYVAYPEVTASAAGERRAAVTRFLAIGAAVVIPVVAVLIAVLGWLLPLLFGHAFRDAVPVGRILLVAALAIALRRVAAEALRGFGSGASATWAELSFVVIFAAAVGPLTAWHQAVGAAVALLGASLASGLVLAVLGLRDRAARARYARAPAL